MNWQEYIIQDAAVLIGKPVIRGTRISVELLLELPAQGWTPAQILESYPHLPAVALPAVYAYLKDCIQHEFYFPLGKTA